MSWKGFANLFRQIWLLRQVGSCIQEYRVIGQKAGRFVEGG